MIQRLSSDEHAAAAGLLARAFHDDPIFVWMIPDEKKRRPWLGWIMRTMLECTGEIHGWHDDGKLGGILAIVPPNGWPIGMGKKAMAHLRAGLFPWPTMRVLTGGLTAQATIDAAHPSEPPHWYVHVLGVDPPHQGKGVGRELLGSVLARADEEKTTTYLETTKPANVKYYEGFGFEVIKEIAPAEGSPPAWSMQRPAKK